MIKKEDIESLKTALKYPCVTFSAKFYSNPVSKCWTLRADATTPTRRYFKTYWILHADTYEEIKIWCDLHGLKINKEMIF